MCAIIGWAGRTRRGQWPLVHELLTRLLIASACRGEDATGFAALDRQRGLVADKQPLPSDAFVRTSRSWKRLSAPACLVAHCRAATHGSPWTEDNRNNHPFIGPNHAVVVNGISHNYQDVADQYDLPLTSECDSEVILRLVEVAETTASGLDACLGELTGGFAAAVLEIDQERVWLCRNDQRPTWLLRLAGINGVFACSTREIADEALKAVFGRTYAAVVEMLVPMASGSLIVMTSCGRLVTAPSPRRCKTSRSLSLR